RNHRARAADSCRPIGSIWGWDLPSLHSTTLGALSKTGLASSNQHVLGGPGARRSHDLRASSGANPQNTRPECPTLLCVERSRLARKHIYDALVCLWTASTSICDHWGGYCAGRHLGGDGGLESALLGP